MIGDDSSGESFLGIHFPWAEGMIDAEYSVDTTSNLISEPWVQTGPDIVSKIDLAGVSMITLRIGPPVSDSVQRFARFNVKR